VNDVVLLFDEFAEIDVDLRRREAGIARMQCVMHELCRFDQILGRQTSAVYACPTDDAFLSHHRCFAELLRAQGRGKRSRAGTEDNEIEFMIVCCISH
jgi:hypothetical protein